MEPIQIVLLFALGLLAGVSGGLLGIGGGLIMVPVLVMMFSTDSHPDAVVHLAVATSLATVVVTGISSALAHQRRQSVEWSSVLRLAPGLMLGAVLAGLFGALIPGRLLAIVFGIFALLMALRLALRSAPGAINRPLPGWFFAPAGVGIGGLSALVGIGGGSLVVPLLAATGRRMQLAVGSASACGVPLALAGTVGWAWPGWQAVQDNALGYVVLPAAALMSLGALLGAPLGARLAHWVAPIVLQRGFAVFLSVLGAYMLVF